jgi:hypothetical protein
MLNSLFENILDKSRTSLSEIVNDKSLLMYILIGMFIVYILYNVLTTTIKYPIIIIIGVIVGKKLKEHFDK